MDMFNFMKKANAIGKYVIILVLVMNLLSVSAAGEANIKSALKALCDMSQTFLGAAVMVLIVLAGTIYAIGQVLGAETRARASVWATAMLTGALIGALIYIVTPIVVRALFSGTGAQINSEGPCDIT